MNGIVEKILTDIIDQDLQRIITNNLEINKYVQKFLQDTGLESKVKLELKQNENVLNIYDIEDQIEKSNNRKIWLKCGGFITIDKTITTPARVVIIAWSSLPARTRT